jgi:hypothetical protein
MVVWPVLALASVTLSRSDQHGVSFRYEPGELKLTLNANGAAQVNLDDADHLAAPGELDLPGKVVRIGISQQGAVRLRVQAGKEQLVPGVLVATVPHVSWDLDSAWYDVPDTNAGAVPAAWAELGPVEVLRGVRIVTVRLNPAHWDAGTGELSRVSSIEATVDFEQPARSNVRPDPLDGCLGRMLLNGREAIDWKLDGAAPMTNPYARSSSWLKILIDSTAIYGISARELAAAGLSLAGLDPKTLALYTVGEHEPNRSYPDTMRLVPVLVEGEEDGRLDPEDRLVFYGLGPGHWQGRCSTYVKNYFTRYNVYWLTWGGARGARIAQGLPPDTSGAPIVRTGRDVLHQERDLDCPARSGLLWIWAEIFKPRDRDLVTFDTDLELSTASRVNHLSGWVMADSAENELAVLLNHHPAGTYRFNQSPPMSPFRFTADTSLPVSFGRNSLTLELRGSGTKRLYLDYLEIDYTKQLSLFSGQLHFLADDTGTFRFRVKDVRDAPVILDVTDHYAPKLSNLLERQGDSVTYCRRLSRPAEFAVACANRLRKPVRVTLRQPGRLLSPAEQADYWIVTPADFTGPAERLARYRTGRIAGIARATARVATLEDIYDDYCFGMEEPSAIKRFFADKRPAYGLLAGDATCDYRGILAKPKPGVPAYESGFGLNPDAIDRTALAYDAWFADFEGEGGSPDVILARITVRTGEEFARFVDKVSSYERAPAGFWNKRFLLLADDEFLGDEGRPDPICFNHIYQCEAMSVLPDNLLERVKVYLTEYPFAGVKNKPAAHAEFMRQMNRGGLLLAFFGHGSGFDLTEEGALNITQVPQIHNEGRTPFCFFGSCSVGRFEDTQFECIAEDLTRMTGGAIGAVGATKATTSASNLVFARNLFTPLLAFPDSTVGFSFFQAWPTDRIYHLFGDPATVLRIPRASGQQLAVTPGTLRPGGDFHARAIVELARARFDWTLFGPLRVRVYRSSRGETSYYLPGLELGRGTGSIEGGGMELRGMFPMGTPLDTFFVANGFYAPVVRSCRISASVTNDSADLSVLRDTIGFSDEPVARDDSAGPTVTFQMDGRRLTDCAGVPSEFELEVKVSDTSGVMVAPVGGAAALFFIDDRRGATDVTDLLAFDDSSCTTARFHVPVKLSGPEDSLFVIVSDNVLNQTVARVLLRPLKSQVLRIDSALVYPNPVDRAARFTFLLTRPANVRIRIYTLAGRMVRDLGDQPGIFGYNEVFWDGRDRDGNLLPNGIYLYVLNALSSSPGDVQSVAARDRLLVLR